MNPERLDRIDALLIELAGSIADGREVDWGEAESTGEGDARDTISQLRILERIATAHRNLQPPEPVPSETPFVRWKHLEIIEEIGGGSFGKVYRARDTHLDLEVALKLALEEGLSITKLRAHINDDRKEESKRGKSVSFDTRPLKTRLSDTRDKLEKWIQDPEAEGDISELIRTAWESLADAVELMEELDVQPVLI